MSRIDSPEALEKFRQEILSKNDADTPCISICAGAGCIASGADEVISAFKSEIKEQGLEGEVNIKETGCPGFCQQGPVVVIYPEEVCYLQVKSEDVSEVVTQTIKEKKVVDRLVFTDPATEEKAPLESDIPFYKNQARNLLGSNIKIDPKSLEDYLALDGYSALSKVLNQMSPEAVVDEVKKSNLRGRGGGGFPAGRKWEGTSKAPDAVKYVIVNADEGDPGAFMDRALLEGNPHSILEGLIIGAYAIGAHEGFIYVRQEYPLAVENINLAIKQAEAAGFLGKDILGSGFDFTVQVHQGAGAFVCGESTALMTAIEGRVGEPRPKYVRSNIKGLWEKPSVLNNVETWANVPLIINKGADWFTQFGTEGSAGTKIFALVGKINNTGLVEVPMGITLRDIIYKIGGGIPDGKKFKAVQTGGPSGGCIPEKLLDLGVDFDELSRVGSLLGSGGMIVMNDKSCMVDMAVFFMKFLMEESCGKCFPCREGVKRMYEVLYGISVGIGREEDFDTLQELCNCLSQASLCDLGKSAPNVVRSALRFFEDEYKTHIQQQVCPSKRCSL